MKALVGMSGGVDSSVTAYLLKEQGYEVEGLSFILYEARLRNTFSGCCSMESINDARRTADRIGIPHAAMDMREEFMSEVIEPFIAAYAKGVTPNPCILCNQRIKFPYLLKFADEKNAGFIATGHYARVINTTGGPGEAETRGQGSAEIPFTDSPIHRFTGSYLRKGIDPKKDQSYVLYVLRPEELSRLILPLGEKRKDEVREIARRLDLPAAKRPESQEICFIEDRNYFKFLENISESTEGPIINVETGNILGSHKGIHLYTIGQRKRLGISSPEPLYVVKIDTHSNTVYVGPKEAALVKEFLVKEINWLSPESGTETRRHGESENQEFTVSLRPRFPMSSFRASVKVRSMMKDEPATLSLMHDGRVRVSYDEPQWAPAPGQSAVFYEGDVVIGGGIII